MPDDVVVGEHPGARRPDRAERGEGLVDDRAEGGRLPQRLEVGEVERLVHLVGAHPVRHLGQRLHPGFGDQHPVGTVLFEHLPPVAVDRVHAVLRPVGHVGLVAAHAAALGIGQVVGQAGGLDHPVGDIHPEAVDAAIEPEPQDLAEPLPDPRVRPVEVGLARVEQVQVPLCFLGRRRSCGARRFRGPSAVAPLRWSVLNPRPGRAAEDGAPVVGRQVAVGSESVAEQVAAALRRAGAGGQRLPEPRVLARGVVGHEVDDDAHSEVVRPGEQGVEVAEIAEQRVDVAVVGDVVAGVLLRRALERAQPDGVDAEVDEIVEVRRDAGQVADAVAGAVGERAGVDLVDDGGAPPLVAGGGEVCGHDGVWGALEGHPHTILVFQDAASACSVAAGEASRAANTGVPGGSEEGRADARLLRCQNGVLLLRAPP